MRIIALVLMGLAWLASFSRADINVVCVGDSLMANASDTAQPDQYGWAELLSNFLNNEVTIINRAVAGTSSKSFIEQGYWSSAKGVTCDYYFIEFGHNDSKEGNKFTDPNTTYKSYLTQYVTEARALGAIPVFITPPARRVFISDIDLKKKNAPYATAMLEVADSLDVACIDMFSISANYYEVWGETASDAYGDNGDRTHFSYMGARWCARWVTSSILWSEHPSIEGLKEYITFEIPNHVLNIPQTSSVQIQLSQDCASWAPWGTSFAHLGGPLRIVTWAEHSPQNFARFKYTLD